MELREKEMPIASLCQSGKSSCVSAAIPFLGGAARRAAGGMGLKSVPLFSRPPSGVQGQRPWHAFGSFRRETKGTRGAGRSARSLRAWELCSHKRSAEGALPPRISWAAGAAPAPALPGERSTPFTYTPKRTKSCTPTCNCGQQKSEDFLLAFFAAKLQHAD